MKCFIRVVVVFYISLFLFLTSRCILFLQAQTNSANLEKKQKKFDQQINEWKIRCDELQTEVDNAQKEARNYSTEVSQQAFSLYLP